MKLYPTLDGALRDIEFSRVNRIHTHFGLGLVKDRLTREDIFTEWLRRLKDSLGEDLNGYVKETTRTFYELITNAYEFGVKQHPKRRFSADFYKGNKGVVIGTDQEAGFLTSEQIDLLKQQRPIPTTREDRKGIGTQIILANADGLLISEQGIYVSKFY